MVGPGSSGAVPLPEEILALGLAPKYLQGFASSPHTFIHLLWKLAHPSGKGMVAEPVSCPHLVLTEDVFFPQFPWTLKKSS